MSKSKGFGDTVAKVIKKTTGIDRTSEDADKQCIGCVERKDKLNEWFPYNKENSNFKSQFLYVYSDGCAWCKKVEVFIDELNDEGYNIERVDIDDHRKYIEDLKKLFKIDCGTPLFINNETGKFICGYNIKDNIKRWINDEELVNINPTRNPPQFNPKNQEEFNKWKGEYDIWYEENKNLPGILTTQEFLSKMKYNEMRKPSTKSDLGGLHVRMRNVETKLDQIIKMIEKLK